MSESKVIVVSAVNLIEGGPLTVLKMCLQALNDYYGHNNDYKIVAIVHDKNLCEYPNIEYFCFPNVKKSWLKQIFFEYYFLRKLSLKLNVYLWLSLHDTTPNVIAKKRIVCCHNPIPFYKTRLINFYFSKKEFIFSFFYRYLYKINIKKNIFIIVKQNWIREVYSSMFNLPKERIIVAVPNSYQENVLLAELNCYHNQEIYSFFYPALPRVFKNFELLCEAVKFLSNEVRDKFEVIITINGKENKYSRWIYRKYKDIPQIKFVGLLSPKQVEEYYQSINCLVFPSKLETWGLPISEFISYRKPMLVSDLSYAHETAMGADMVDFFNVSKVENLVVKMRMLINGDQNFLKACKRELVNVFFQLHGKNF
jgi:hypothetical protein